LKRIITLKERKREGVHKTERKTEREKRERERKQREIK